LTAPAATALLADIVTGGQTPAQFAVHVTAFALSGAKT